MHPSHTRRRRRRHKQALVLALALGGLPLQGCAEVLALGSLFSGLSGLITGGATIYGAVQRLGSSSKTKPRTTRASTATRTASETASRPRVSGDATTIRQVVKRNTGAAPNSLSSKSN